MNKRRKMFDGMVNPKDIIIVICPSTQREYCWELPDWSEPLPKKRLQCPNCHRFIFRKKRAKEKDKWEMCESDILHEFKHKFVQDVLKLEVFGSKYEEILMVQRKYNDKKFKLKHGSEQWWDCLSILKAIGKYLQCVDHFGSFREHQLRIRKYDEEPPSIKEDL